MITEVLNLAQWEWFKLQRRWLPWILLAMLLGLSQLSVWADRDELVLPGSLDTVLGNIQTFTLLLLAVLAASVTGIEYGLGTLRPALARGTGRWQYLAGKLLLLVLVIAATLLLILLATAVSSVIALALGIGQDPGPEAAGWLDVAEKFVRIWFGLISYGALVVLVTLLTRSTAVGNAISLAYFFAEQIISLILVALLDWFEKVTDYLLISNITAFTGGISLGQGGPGEASLLRPGLVLLAYILVLGGTAFWLFNRRDIAGARAS